VTVALMNLVTAIIVENAMAKGREDTEERQSSMRKLLKTLLPEIQRVFDRLDVDHSGTLDLLELEVAARQGNLNLPECIKEFVAPDRLMDVFEYLDADQSGEIDKHEFVDGISSLAVSGVPIETTQILQLLRHTHEVLMDTRVIIGKMSGEKEKMRHLNSRMERRSQHSA